MYLPETMAEREVCMIRNDYEKSVLVKQIIQRLNPLYILTLNTCSSMSMETLNRHLSLLSAIVNKDKLKLKKKWYLQKDKSVKLFCFNEISKGGHIHSNCFLDCPPEYEIKDVIKYNKNGWQYIGDFKHYINAPNKVTGESTNKKHKRLKFKCDVGKHTFGKLSNYVNYQVKNYEDDIQKGFSNQYSKMSNHLFNIW